MQLQNYSSVDPQWFRELMRVGRARERISQRELAVRIGRSQWRAHRIEIGSQKPTDEEMTAIVTTLKLEPLLEGSARL